MSYEIEKLNKILTEVGQRDGIEGLRLSQEGTAAITFRGPKKVCFEYVLASEKLFIYTPLMRLPQDARRQVCYEIMLDCNFLKLETGQGELAISQSTNEAIYQIGLDVAHLNADSVDRAIDDLLSRRKECLYRLQLGRPPEMKNQRPSHSGHSTFNRIAILNNRLS